MTRETNHEGRSLPKMLARATGWRCLSLGDGTAQTTTGNWITSDGHNLAAKLNLSGGNRYGTAEDSFQAGG